jgi:cell wall-associated NlpC family hydrolase
VVAQLDEATVTAHQAGAAAQAATLQAQAEAARAADAQRAYAGMNGALEAMAVTMYETGSDGLQLVKATHDIDELAWSRIYAEHTVDPSGLLGERKADATRAHIAAAAAHRDQLRAQVNQAQAAAALAVTTAAQQALRQQLIALGGQGAALAAERTNLSTQLGANATSSTSLQFTPSSPVPPQVATVGVALQWAFAELGKPYVWGATGPNTFDCSGLTQYVWHKAGVDIPRVAADQDTWSIPVPLSQLLPGDLVFYGTTDIHHVGIYIGNGLMINAPHTGAVVSVSSIWWSDLNGFGRVHTIGVPVPDHSPPTPATPAPPAVIGAPVPSQPTPPPGWKAAPGATAPMPGYGNPSTPSTTMPSATVPATSSTSAPSSTTTTTLPPVTDTAPASTDSTTTTTSDSTTTSTTTAAASPPGT